MTDTIAPAPARGFRRVDQAHGVAVEDSINGARSAVAAGYRAIGIVLFVPGEERAERSAALRAEGADTVVSSWSELADLLL